MSFIEQRNPVRIALQGGGALGSYSAGVLDALLASRRIELTHFSGTSAGALNAVICASALATGGPREARLALASFWQALESSSIEEYFGHILGPVAKGFREWLWNNAAAMPSLYQASLLPSMSATPLGSILEAHVDLQALQAPGAPRVFITLTNVRTGLPRVISNADLTLDAILASACLPKVFRAVEVDGDPFWDGGFTGNPTLWPLIMAEGPADILLVQLSPNVATESPTSAAAVDQRISEIMFHSSLVAEMQAIHAIRDVTGRAAISAGGPNEATNCFTQARFHRVGPPPDGLIGAGGAGDRSGKHLQALWKTGRSEARRFLMRDGRQIGLEETLDIRVSFIDQSKSCRDVLAESPATTPAAGQDPLASALVAPRFTPTPETIP